jgi:hypothetical protein
MPKDIPIRHLINKELKALGLDSLQLDSVNIVLIKIWLQLKIPQMKYIKASELKDLQNPNKAIVRADPIKEIFRAFFLPIRSQAKPHKTLAQLLLINM